MTLFFVIECWRDGTKGVERVSNRIVSKTEVFPELEQAEDSMRYAQQVTGFDHWAECHPVGCPHLTGKTAGVEDNA